MAPQDSFLPPESTETATIQRRIVPLRGPIAPPTAPPHLTYGGGQLLTSVQVYTIFWGSSDWQQAPQSGLIPELNQFFDSILTSSLIDLLAQYGVPGQAIGHGSRIGTNTLTANQWFRLPDPTFPDKFTIPPGSPVTVLSREP